MTNVVNGKNGFLFLAGDQNAVIKQHTGERLLKDRQLAKWQMVFSNRKRSLEIKGIELYLQIVPDKHPVYPEHLPDEFQLINKRNIDLFLEYVEPVLEERVNYPLSAIVSASDQQQVYFKRDSHWTDRGAYIAYLDLMEIIKKDLPDISILKDPLFNPGTFRGDLARLSGVEADEATEVFNEVPGVKTIFNNKVKNTGRIKIFTNSQAINNKTILVFGSSSTLYTLKFLTHDFKNVIFYWSGNFDHAAINHYKPDLIINQIRERHLIRPADDVVGFTTTEMAFVKSFATIGEAISPISFNKKAILKNCLAKAGNKSNQVYQKYLNALCERLKLNSIYEFSIKLDRRKYRLWMIRLFINARLFYYPLYSGSLLSRLNGVIEDSN
jgi:alginate O-acetyltransferase complex protein AlgJ